ncbi:hypothetical protein AMATHDRAFT_141912 [Amanita thiersii Skay4041]|uniref:PWWP domain-containing protein n=1 Tax=Amanita thiersii Skay4041 TaxID=703135 RepID=A0A2A9NL60_9AGAR|nr:hypothetical protein AMATHDRAFT_141912 [Amanita thiersii Skay4041]
MEEHSWDAVREKDEDGWVPVPADEALQLPGEIILSRGSDWDKSYWPARILAYLPPKSKREKEGKYQIEYLDRTTGLVKRSAFFSSDEDGFATCKLGQFESSYDEVGNDSDSEDLLGSLGSTRSPSPALMDSPPTQEEFCALSIRAQFVYTKPVLIAILNDRYPPAKGRHENFVKGGPARKAVVDNAALRGDMTPRSVGELQRWICEWCLRDERFAQRQFDQGAASNRVTGAGSDTTKGSESSNAAEVSSLVIIGHDAVLPHATTTKAESLSAQMKPDDVLSDLTEIEDTQSLDAGHSLITKMPRQQGCEAYETLSSVEKIDYCLNVLLPEAILQILLWRNGLRRAVELLSLDEEERLHDQGIQLLQVTDWVFDVMRLRNSRLRLLAKTESNESINNNQKIYEKRGGGRLRSAIPKVNYQE